MINTCTMENMNKNLQSPTKLTEFAPLQPEEKQDTVGQLFSRFFKFGKSTLRPEQATSSTENADNISQESLPSWATIERDEASDTVVYDVDVAEGRSLPSVLKRISNLLALKSNNFQAYSDSELKQYWMPDSVSKECYECCEKFTTFRRRHHCRVCGQIFCSSCCNQQIPGKIFGCTGDLRVCTYCCKVVLSYLQSNDIGSDLTADLRALQENLQSKYGDISSSTSPSQSTLSPSSAMNESVTEKAGTVKRKISVGYQEEKFASGRGASSYLTSEEKCRALQNSASLRNLYEEICRPNGGISLRKQRYRLRTYVNTFLGSELVEWLIYQQKANTRIQAAAFCQALLDGGYIICLAESPFFIDGNSPYKIGIVSSPEVAQNAQTFEASMQDEPIWVQNIPQDSNNTDSEGEQVSPSTPHVSGRIPSSTSYTLDLNVGANTVYLSKPPALIASSTSDDFDGNDENGKVISENVTIRTSEHHERVPESGWHNATQLREENGESAAYKLLTAAFEQHETTLVKQLLSVAGLSLTWSNIIMPLIHEIVDVIRPDINHNAEELDIRNYIQFKKLTGGARSDCQLVRGIVFTKNVAHKAMSCRLENPKILLLECAIVYQRTEGRLMSLDPVLMQEQQFLTHVADRILALKPDIVLVHRNMSRLAQDILRQKGVTIVLNVKQSVLERIARCTDADLVSSIDARISAPRLGTCKTFYLKNFDTDRGGCKTLMFFEGLSQPHLGSTVLLRGASKSELLEIKSVASFLLFTCYNWRLEKSFVMDEFAYPRVTKDEFFDDSKENSPISPVADINVRDLSKQRRKMITSNVLFGSNESDTEYFNSTKVEKEQKNKVVEEKKSVTEPIQDFSDPLHSYNVDDVFKENTTQKMSVADLPFSNQFRKALDDTILCISPYLVFSVPYLETENGRKCKLRNYFPAQIYYSEQFTNNKKKKLSKDLDITNFVKNEKNMKPPHAFVTKPISASIDSNEVQTLLTHFRACGGRLPKKPLLDINPIEEINKEKPHEDALDVLNPRNHQRMAVLFCSFSKESINAPAFCVNPWVVYMAFYGQNDIPLGCFLMRYCFSPKYHCQSKCETPMLKHVRKFVHYTGCVSITLNHIDSLSNEEEIMMWSWCSRCQQVSPMVKMSVDTWSFSFAKYLELRFHGGLFSRRGNSHCQHSLHHDHHQYFTYKNTVASFRYTSIDLWEISLPPTILQIYYDKEKQQQDLMDETKSIALNGHEVYSIIQEKLSVMPTDEDIINTYKQLLLKEQQTFKQRIEEIQMKLTSPTIENKNIISDDSGDTQTAMWKIHDGVVRIKRIIVEAVDQWNAKLSESITHKKEDKKKDKTSSQELDSPNTSTETKVSISDVSDSERVFKSSEAVRTTKKNRSLDKPDDEDVSSSPRGHHRSQSDGTVLNQLEDMHDCRKLESEKKTVKTLFSLFTTTQFTPIANPFDSEDHYTLPSGIYAPIAVYESEPSSMIAYALNSYDYKKQFDDLTGKKTQEQSPSPLSKRRSNSDKSEDLSQSMDKSSSIKLFFRSKDSKSDLLASTSTNADAQVINESPPLEKSSDDRKNNKIEVQFEDSNCKFLCIVYHAEKFSALRKLILPEGEEAYIRSLSRCVPWDARGGKSGSTFRKTLDDRFIIKAMPQKEIQLFLDSAHNYFAYMTKCFTSGQPTLLGKIVGIYQIVYKNNATNASLRTFLLVMENLFYNRVVMQKFDLKGSMRNRLVNPDNQDGEIVLLDENLLKMTCENPLYIHPHSKAVLTAAIQNDTEFLSNQCVMDYSLLVGLDSEKKELVLGIIDYIRTFTWDKKLETIVKKTGILGGQGKLPTIMPPQEYQKRFIEAMHRYFLEVPDPWVGMDRGLET